MAGSQYFGVGRLATVQSVSYTGTAGTIANAISNGVQKVRVAVTTDAFIYIGKRDATTSDTPLAGGFASAEYFTCFPGEKVSAIQSSAGGTLYVTEIA